MILQMGMGFADGNLGGREDGHGNHDRNSGTVALGIRGDVGYGF